MAWESMEHSHVVAGTSEHWPDHPCDSCFALPLHHLELVLILNREVSPETVAVWTNFSPTHLGSMSSHTDRKLNRFRQTDTQSCNLYWTCFISVSALALTQTHFFFLFLIDKSVSFPVCSFQTHALISSHGLSLSFIFCHQLSHRLPLHLYRLSVWITWWRCVFARVFKVHRACHVAVSQSRNSVTHAVYTPTASSHSPLHIHLSCVPLTAADHHVYISTLLQITAHTSRSRSTCTAFSHLDHIPAWINTIFQMSLCVKQSTVRYLEHFSDNVKTSRQLYLDLLE